MVDPWLTILVKMVDHLKRSDLFSDQGSTILVGPFAMVGPFGLVGPFHGRLKMVNQMVDQLVTIWLKVGPFAEMVDHLGPMVGPFP